MLGPHMVLQRDTQARVYGTATPLADINLAACSWRAHLRDHRGRDWSVEA